MKNEKLTGLNKVLLVLSGRTGAHRGDYTLNYSVLFDTNVIGVFFLFHLDRSYCDGETQC